MKQATLLLLSTITIVVSCAPSSRVVLTKTGVDDIREMGELPLKIEVKKSAVKQGNLSLWVRVTTNDPIPLVKAEVYKFVDGKEVFVGNADKQGNFKIVTTFSCPDTFSFISLSYQKKYLYVGENR